MELTGLFTLAIAAALAWPRAEVPQQRIVLLPSADGSPSAVVVKGADGERLLNTPFAGLEVMASGSTQVVTLPEAEVRARYAQVLEAQPLRPRSFLLYFVTGSDSQLTTESSQTVSGLQSFLQSRPAPEVTVVGHTDRTGGAPLNDALSLKRAQTVRELIRQAGIAVEGIPVYGQGSREPIASGAQEGLNRRVEIHVR